MRYRAFAPAILGILACIADTAQAVLLPDDLVGYWALESDLKDSAPGIQGIVGSGSDGAFTGSVTPTFVTVDGRLALDMLEATVGNNYVRTQTYLDDGAKTVVLWANSTYTAGAFWAGNECSTANRLYFGTSDSGVRPWIGGGGNSSTGTFSGTASNDGEWHMYALTDTGYGGSLNLYQDGEPTAIATLDYSGSTASEGGTNPFVIGQAGGGGPRYARAYIDDVAVFNRELGTHELAALYSFGSVSAYMEAIPSMPTYSWLFDGNAKAQLGGIDGTLTGQGTPGNPPTFSGDMVASHAYEGNQCLQLEQSSASQQYVDFGAPLQLTDAITASIWFKADGAPGSGQTQFLVGEYGSGERSWSLATYSTGGTLRLLLSDTGDWTSTIGKDYYSTQSVTDGEWHNAVFTFEASSEPGGDGAARLYLDGVELTVGDGLNKSKDNAITSLNASNLPLIVGTRSDLRSYSTGDYFSGLIDELAIWNSVLTADEVQWLYYSSVHAIPEPSAFVLLVLSIVCFTCRRPSDRST